MCDTLVSLTGDGVLLAKNSDRDPNEAQVLRWYPAATHDEARVRCTWSEVDQVPRTHAVLLSQPWWMWGAEMGANEHGVAIGNEAVFTRGAGKERGASPLLGMDLLRLALERARTADEAVGVIVELLERHGQGGSCSHEHPGFTYDNSFLVADPDGAVVLETAGRRWATERVTGRGRSISNGLTIPAFAKAHADPVRGRVAQCAARRTRTEAAAERADDVAALLAALRDHGGPAPRWSPVNGALSAPCAHAAGFVTTTQSTAAWVADLRGAPRHWVTGTSAPCTSLAKPVRVEEPVDVDPASMPTNTYDPAYRWWRHERLHRLALRDHAAALGRFGPERDRVEQEWLAEPPDPAAAFAEADRLEEGWLEDLAAARLRDTRPGWLRRKWRATDRAAGMPEEDR
ncbi:carcinine hydrolase/isopenicillin-N N-acyltransferase family protein [Nocardioides taihuensis]|uniref:Carcinine hydrolase/isopenicillin-N N-acyltransferase family protein n=1 Tax=Nocardioides taihuensis TaxID=1835606 RepID=A0ABW0BGC0_9ACTN